MAHEKVVSIIIPCYNYGTYLAQALNTLLSQTYQNWECLVVDDGSKDNTATVAQGFALQDPRFKYIYQENAGPNAARNNGLRHSSGDYIQFLDADDLMHARKLECHVAYLKAQPEIDLVFGDVYMFDRDPVEQKQKFQFATPVVSGKGEVILRSLLTDNFFLIHCPLFKRELVRDVGYMKEDLRAFEDWHFWFRCALAEKTFQYAPAEETEVYVRSHGTNATGNRQNMWRSKISARLDLIRLTKQHLAVNSGILSQTFIKEMWQTQNALLHLEKARYHMFYGNVLQGLVNTLKYSTYSKRPFFGFYDSAYWLKERIKAKY